MAIPRRPDRRAAARHADKMRNLGTPLTVLPEEFEAARRILGKAHAYGMDDAMIARQVGLEEGGICKIRNGLTGKMHRTTYEALMRLRPERPVVREHATRTRLPAGVQRDSTGTRRRAQALRADGFPNVFIAGLLGVTSEAVSSVARSDRPTVHQTTHAEWVGLYEKLAGTSPLDHGVSVGVMKFTRAFALKQGFAPASCWDADTIDDPEAFPEWTGACGTVHGRTVHEREGIPICAACKAARARRSRELAAPEYTFNGERLQYLMDRAEVSKEVLAEALSVNRETVWAWRAGRFQPNLERLESIADYFGIHPSELKR